MSKLDEILEHHGVLGMKWGVRNGTGTPRAATDVTIKSISRKGNIKTAGGKNQPASEEAKSKAVAKRKAKSSGVASLSNKELQTAVQRMNLEQQFKNLSAQQNPGKKFVSKLLGQQGSALANSVATNETTKVATAIKDKRK